VIKGNLQWTIYQDIDAAPFSLSVESESAILVIFRILRYFPQEIKAEAILQNKSKKLMILLLMTQLVKSGIWLPQKEAV